MENTSFIMEEFLTEFSIYSGKIGLDNLLLMIVGALYYYVYHQNKTAPFAHLHKRTALFFCLYGFLFDLYRLKSLRWLLLMRTENFQAFKTLLLLLFLIYLYDGLILAILEQRRSKKK